MNGSQDEDDREPAQGAPRRPQLGLAAGTVGRQGREAGEAAEGVLDGGHGRLFL